MTEQSRASIESSGILSIGCRESQNIDNSGCYENELTFYSEQSSCISIKDIPLDKSSISRYDNISQYRCLKCPCIIF
ncbi:unnamed protein product [Blepharisma stoltei]|uniref:Uncharacterized protein n=1 Tax=Blepharisma stoltei TaxID=1481888 RepID=A0AAU9KGL8_9CILI|nr:unnamed protein product [Blepharisma stoltei]